MGADFFSFLGASAISAVFFTPLSALRVWKTIEQTPLEAKKFSYRDCYAGIQNVYGDKGFFR